MSDKSSFINFLKICLVVGVIGVVAYFVGKWVKKMISKKENYRSTGIDIDTGYPQWLLDTFLLNKDGKNQSIIKYLGNSYRLAQWDYLGQYDNLDTNAVGDNNYKIYASDFYDLYTNKNNQSLVFTAGAVGSGTDSSIKTTKDTSTSIKKWSSDLSLNGTIPIIDEATFGFTATQNSGGGSTISKNIQTFTVEFKNGIGTLSIPTGTGQTSFSKTPKYTYLQPGMLNAFLSILNFSHSDYYGTKQGSSYDFTNSDTGAVIDIDHDVTDVSSNNSHWSNQKSFFELYGDHICVEIDFGAKLVMLKTINDSSSDLSSYVQNDLCLNVAQIGSATNASSDNAAAAQEVTDANTDVTSKTSAESTAQTELDAANNLPDPTDTDALKSAQTKLTDLQQYLDDINTLQVLGDTGLGTTLADDQPFDQTYIQSLSPMFVNTFTTQKLVELSDGFDKYSVDPRTKDNLKLLIQTATDEVANFSNGINQDEYKTLQTKSNLIDNIITTLTNLVPLNFWQAKGKSSVITDDFLTKASKVDPQPLADGKKIVFVGFTTLNLSPQTWTALNELKTATTDEMNVITQAAANIDKASKEKENTIEQQQEKVNQAKDDLNNANDNLTRANNSENEIKNTNLATVKGCENSRQDQSSTRVVNYTNNKVYALGGDVALRTGFTGLTPENLVNNSLDIKKFLNSVNEDPAPRRTPPCGRTIQSLLQGENCLEYCADLPYSDDIASSVNTLIPLIEELINTATGINWATYNSLMSNANESLNDFQITFVNGGIAPVNSFQYTNLISRLNLLLQGSTDSGLQGPYFYKVTNINNILQPLIRKLNVFITQTGRSCLSQGYNQFDSTSGLKTLSLNPATSDSDYGVRSFSVSGDSNKTAGVIDFKFEAIWDFCFDAANTLFNATVDIPDAYTSNINTIRLAASSSNNPTVYIQNYLESTRVTLQTYYLVKSGNLSWCPANSDKNAADRVRGIPPSMWLQAKYPPVGPNGQDWTGVLQYDCRNAYSGCTMDSDCGIADSYFSGIGIPVAVGTPCYSKNALGSNNVYSTTLNPFPYTCPGSLPPKITEPGVQQAGDGGSSGTQTDRSNNNCYRSGFASCECSNSGGGRYDYKTVWSTANSQFCGAG